MDTNNTLAAIEAAIGATHETSKQITSTEHIAYLKTRLAASMQPLQLDGTIESRPEYAKPGVYLFEVKFPFQNKTELEAFGERWGKAGAKNPRNALPRYYSTRAKNHYGKLETGEFIPFYLGKEQNVSERIRSHILDVTDDSTYSLKLLSRPELLEGCEVRYGAVTLDIDEDAYFSVALIESALRQELQPIIGSGRS